MGSRWLVVMLVVATSVPVIADSDCAGTFTGDVLFPIYVSDVAVSGVFYRDVLGFGFVGYWDYEADGYVATW